MFHLIAYNIPHGSNPERPPVTVTKVFRPKKVRRPTQAFEIKTLSGVRVKKMWGGSEDFVVKIREGFRPAVIDELAGELGAPQQMILEVAQIAPATLVRRRKEGRLSKQESDRLYRIGSVFQDVTRLFEGDKTRAARWMNRPERALGNNTPLKHLDTEAGAEAVRNLVGRLEHGIVT